MGSEASRCRGCCPPLMVTIGSTSLFLPPFGCLAASRRWDCRPRDGYNWLYKPFPPTIRLSRGFPEMGLPPSRWLQLALQAFSSHHSAVSRLPGDGIAALAMVTIGSTSHFLPPFGCLAASRRWDCSPRDGYNWLYKLFPPTIRLPCGFMNPDLLSSRWSQLPLQAFSSTRRKLYSTVTDFARFLGLSTSSPLATLR